MIKEWVYQNLLLVMIGWPLMIYEIPIFLVESVDLYLNGYFHKWVGVSESMSKASLNCATYLEVYDIESYD